MVVRHGLMGVLVLALLTGCSLPAVGPESVEPVAQSGAGQFDVSRWKPSVTVTPPTFTDEEAMELRDKYLRFRAEERGIADLVDDIPLVRWTTRDEFFEVVSECVTDAGFPTVADEEGWTFPEGRPLDQEQAWSLAFYECEAKYTMAPKYITMDYSDDQLHVLYEFWTEVLVPCATAHGISVPDDAPTVETYISRFRSNGDLWMPDLSGMVALHGDDLDRFLEECPQNPPSGPMYGD